LRAHSLPYSKHWPGEKSVQIEIDIPAYSGCCFFDLSGQPFLHHFTTANRSARVLICFGILDKSEP